MVSMPDRPSTRIAFFWAEAEKLSAGFLETLAKNGMKVQPPSPKLAGEYKELGKKLTAEWLEKAGADGKAVVTREVDAGLEVLEVDLPAVVTTDLRLNEPRFIKLPDIMKSKSKPIEALELAALGVEPGDHLTAVNYAPPPKRGKGVMVKDVAELVAALKNKGLV